VKYPQDREGLTVYSIQHNVFGVKRCHHQFAILSFLPQRSAKQRKIGQQGGSLLDRTADEIGKP
jgi:hypothetical protein